MNKNLPALTAGATFVATVALANWLTAEFGLVPIGFGLMVTAGTFAAAAALITRDWVQQTTDHWWIVPILIVVGAGISVLTSTPEIALASGLAFLVSELVDWGVFTPLRHRSLPGAVVASSVVAAPVDTVLFLQLAGFPLTWQAVLGQFLVKTGMALLVAGFLYLRSKP